jgi:protein phosphatase
MGTTLVAMVVENERAIIGHVGDSRAYLLREGALRRLTSDHSWVNEQVKLGLLSDEAAQRHPMRNIVTRALGSRTEASAELREEGIRPGDIFLLCSDGLNTMVPDPEIEAILQRSGEDPERACRELVSRANERGGEDNTTVVVVHVGS